MRRIQLMTSVLGILVMCGCRTDGPLGLKELATPDPAVGETFTFVIESNPDDAEIFLRQSAGGEKLLGKTPLTLSLRLVRTKKRDRLGLPEKRLWQVHLARDSPFLFEAHETSLNVIIPELILRKPGYEQEVFSANWTFPEDLTKRINSWKTEPIDHVYRKTVVFQRPTQSRAQTTVTIDCATGPAKIYTLGATGNAGILVGTTPLVCSLGYSPVCDVLGTIKDWKYWPANNPALWEGAPNGDLFLNVVLMRDGYAPEKVRRWICNFKDFPPEHLTALFQMVRPIRPEAVFKLNLDSLPSAASIYVLNADGSLGQEFGKTPIEIAIGMAQESIEESPGRYVHKDWRLWPPVGLIRWDVQSNGGLVVNLTCAVYKDGFAVENIVHPIFQLKPGLAYPKGMALTVPLPSAEQAAVRESLKLQQTRTLGTSESEGNHPRSTVIWQAPPLTKRPDDQQAPTAAAETVTEAPPPRSWWNRLWHGKSSPRTE